MVISSLLTACSPLGLVDRLTPETGYHLEGAIPFDPSGRLVVDVYRPSEDAAPHPVVVFFYGGSWQTGSREGYRFVGQALASRGFVCVIPDYRLYPEIRYPAFLEDAARAVRWVRDHVGTRGGDADRIFLMGHSAGAHIAAMLVAADSFLENEGVSPGRLAGVVGLAGPYDFLPIRDPVLQTIFGPKEAWPATQPMHWVDGDEPPMLLAAGGRDVTVRPGNTRRLAARIRDRGGRVEEIVYPWLGHVTILGALAPPLRWVSPVLEDVTSFLERHGDPSWRAETSRPSVSSS